MSTGRGGSGAASPRLEGDDPGVIELFTPGRVCLFGEHSDWSGTYRRFNAEVEPGVALVCGTQFGLHARVRAHPSRLVARAVVDSGEERTLDVPMDRAELLRVAEEGGFWSYACGVAYEISTHFCVGGLEVDNYLTDLPVKKGLSSSAAVCVTFARAFNRVYGLKLSVRGEMDAAYRGEVRTPSRCGRLDQCCAFGRAVVRMGFDGDALDTEEVPLGGPLHLVLVDLGGAKDTKVILRDLNRAYPFAQTDAERGLHELLGPLNRDTVRRAAEALRAGDAEGVGRLMTEAQANFDRLAAPLCEAELRAPLLHRLLGLPALAPLVWGGKGVGSQGDGTAQLVARGADAQAAAAALVRRELGMACTLLTLGGGGDARPSRAVVVATDAAAAAPGRAAPAGLAPPALMPLPDGSGGAEAAVARAVRTLGAAGVRHALVLAPRGPHAAAIERAARAAAGPDGTVRVVAELDEGAPLGEALRAAASFAGSDRVLVARAHLVTADAGAADRALRAAARRPGASCLALAGDTPYHVVDARAIALLHAGDADLGRAVEALGGEDAGSGDAAAADAGTFDLRHPAALFAAIERLQRA